MKVIAPNRRAIPTASKVSTPNPRRDSMSRNWIGSEEIQQYHPEPT